MSSSTIFKHPHKMSICTMINNEANYIQEWIEYHLLMKVDHFYIYNDKSTDNIVEVLKPYTDKGIVSLIAWDKNRTVSSDRILKEPTFTIDQRYCIADCLFNHGNESQWMGVWDVDEYLVMNKKYANFADVIDNYLDPQKLDVLQVPMTNFGPSKHTFKPAGLLMENYHWRMNKTLFGYNPVNDKFMGKSIYRSGCGEAEVHFTPHLPAHCNPKAEFADLDVNPDYPVHFKHFFSKSWQEFNDKMLKWGWKLSYERFLNDTRYYHDVYDDSMKAFAPAVKKAIACSNNPKECASFSQEIPAPTVTPTVAPTVAPTIPATSPPTVPATSSPTASSPVIAPQPIVPVTATPAPKKISILS